ncbi:MULTISPECIES: YcfL family protein [Campylobacter]|uniref:Putative periplasmic lipoprotein (DUF1425 domain) n=1 Tax=Campylobacter porcelli TaxID=1660073 RepID=A0A1X9SYH1_9BACT|nr:MULTISPECIES: YcfL family protein [unclassified Campylobacter]MCR8679702.1 YcfL family protein [Campylobacter sp. RM19072]MCR8696917.1 YcfL family protein [Campylobacter sp. RM19073]MEE3705478.1 YcfL family protein [Campylobacter sp. CX2-8023-23]MEE3745213.1 YcfL family protein [Campylobacter sp. CX2-4855-23]MEE3777411.1 YcfL family protein [Campylobacter sp. CX2-4080-23]
MKKIAMFLVCAMLFGCAGNSDIRLENQGYSSNLVSLEAIDKDIIQDINQRFNELGLLEFQIILKSTKDMDLAYRVAWLDESGFELRNSIDESYKVLRLNAYRQISISKVAQDKRAKSFKIYLTTKGL